MVKIITPKPHFSYSCQKCQKFIEFDEEQEMEEFVKPLCDKCKEKQGVRSQSFY
jgi:predicted SprT family Zn-dependent metalloprotease